MVSMKIFSMSYAPDSVRFHISGTVDEGICVKKNRADQPGLSLDDLVQKNFKPLIDSGWLSIFADASLFQVVKRSPATVQVLNCP